MSAPLIVVVGATGNQGRSVVQHLLQTRQFRIRALTRKPESDEGQRLKGLSVDVVQCDISKEDDLVQAFSGSYGVFAMTQFWEHGVEGEIAQGKLMADVAYRMGVLHYIYSSLPSPNKLTGGKIKVPHLDSKYEVEEYTRTLGFHSLNFVWAGFYMENLKGGFTKVQNDTVIFSWACNSDAQLCMIAIEDLGKVVAALFQEPDKYNGQSIPVCGDSMTPDEMAATFQRVTGRKARYIPIPPEEYAKLPIPNARELADMFRWFNTGGLFGPHDPMLGKKICPDLMTFEEWLKKTGWKGPSAHPPTQG